MSFSAAAEANRDYMCGVARKFRVPEHEVEDLVQDALLIGHRRWSTFAHQSSPRSWLCGILLNVLLDRRRKASNYARRLDAYATLGRQNVSRDDEFLIERHELEEFLASLDERTRDVFVKFEIEGYKGREVAEALSVNANTAMSWLRNARLALRHRFEARPNRVVIGDFFRPRRSMSTNRARG